MTNVLGNEGKTFIKHVLARALSILFQARALIMVYVISRHIGSREYGVWSQMLNTIQFMLPVALLQLDVANIRFLAGEPDPSKRSAGIWTSALYVAGCLSIISIGVFLVQDWVAYTLFGSEEWVMYVPWLIFWLWIHATNTYFRSYFRVTGSIGIWTLVEGAQSLLQAMMILVTTFLPGARLTWVILAFVTAELPFTVHAIMRLLAETGRPRFAPKSVHPYLKYSLPLLPVMVFSWVVNYSDQIMITHAQGIESTGVYSTFYLLGRLPHSATAAALSFVLVTVTSRYWAQGERERVRKLLSFSIKLLFLALYPLCIILFHNMEYLTGLLAGIQHERALLLAGLVLGSTFASSLYNIYSQVLMLTGRTSSITLSHALSAALNIALNLMWIPIWGIEGAAAATVVSYLLQTAFTWWLGRRHVSVLFPGAFVAKATVAASALFAITMWSSGAFHLRAILGLLGICVYLAILYVTRAFDTAELSVFGIKQRADS